MNDKEYKDKTPCVTYYVCKLYLARVSKNFKTPLLALLTIQRYIQRPVWPRFPTKSHPRGGFVRIENMNCSLEGPTEASSEKALSTSLNGTPPQNIPLHGINIECSDDVSDS